MNANEIIKSIEAEQLKAEVPQFHVGDTVRVYGKIKEGNRERIQVFEGIVLKKQGGSSRETFTVRKFSNGVGVEKTWPLHSPNVEKVEIVRFGKVRRAKLNYLRGRKIERKPYPVLENSRWMRLIYLIRKKHTGVRKYPPGIPLCVTKHAGVRKYPPGIPLCVTKHTGAK